MQTGPNFPQANLTDALKGPDLSPWDSGPGVAELQQLLNAHGFKLQMDGDFGVVTEAAVRAYQRQQGLQADGIVNQSTWSALKTTVQPGTRTLRQGSTGIDVFELQGLLQVCGYAIHRDGIFGAQTHQAVVAFQTRHKLKPDGQVGPITWTVLRGKPPLPQPETQTNWFFDGRRWR